MFFDSASISFWFTLSRSSWLFMFEPAFHWVFKSAELHANESLVSENVTVVWIDGHDDLEDEQNKAQAEEAASEGTEDCVHDVY